MKKVVLMLVLCSFFISAQSNHTITIDGTNDFNTTNERFISTSNTDLYGYVTWDATHLFFGVSGNSFHGGVTDNSRIYHIYIDTDPQVTASSGTGSTTGITWRWTPTLPFSANYHYAFKTVDYTEYKDIYNIGTSNWIGSSFVSSNNKGSSYWELKISRADIGAPAKIYVAMYVEEDWDGGYICGGIPNDLFTNNNTPGNIIFGNHWLGLNLVDGINPNALGNHDQALPVEMNSFTAIFSRKNVELKWTTATETNNYGFEIQRSALSSQQSDNMWSKIGFVEGNGTTNAPKSYTFVDNSASGKTSYRLKQIDRDGKFEYSQTVEVTAASTPKEFALEQNYPNPFNPATAISFQLSAVGFTTLKIYDAIGREVSTLVSEVKEAGTYTAQFDGARFSSGIYFAKLTSDRKTQMKKLLLLK